MLATLDDAIGNLAFSASIKSAPAQGEFISVALIPQARAILLSIEQGMPIPMQVEGKVRPNTAMGGARPKLTVQDNGRLWLAKFPSARDDGNIPCAKLEAAMLNLAERCGINSAKARIVCDDVLLVERFDRGWVDGPRSGWRRDAFLSARTLFFANNSAHQRPVGGSYASLANELTRYIAAPSQDKQELFRRMVFNVFISNTDDHDRNHALIADDLPGTYRLAPAYDLVPRLHGTLRRHHAMVLGAGSSIATRENLLADCSNFGLDTKAAAGIIDRIEAGVSGNWRSCLAEQGLDDPAIDRLKNCFSCIYDTEAELALAIVARRSLSGAGAGEVQSDLLTPAQDAPSAGW